MKYIEPTLDVEETRMDRQEDEINSRTCKKSKKSRRDELELWMRKDSVHLNILRKWSKTKSDGKKWDSMTAQLEYTFPASFYNTDESDTHSDNNNNNNTNNDEQSGVFQDITVTSGTPPLPLYTKLTNFQPQYLYSYYNTAINSWCEIQPMTITQSYKNTLASIYPQTTTWTDSDWITFSKFGAVEGSGFFEYNAKYESLRTQGKGLPADHIEYRHFQKYLADVQQVCNALL